MGRVLLWLFLALLLAAGGWIYFFLVDAGVFLGLKPTSVGVCRQVTSGGVVGVEDIASIMKRRLPTSRVTTVGKRSVPGLRPTRTFAGPFGPTI